MAGGHTAARGAASSISPVWWYVAAHALGACCARDNRYRRIAGTPNANVAFFLRILFWVEARDLLLRLETFYTPPIKYESWIINLRTTDS